MLSTKNLPFFKFFRQRLIARKVRSGIVPEGVSTDEIWEALKATRPIAAVEVFGFLYAKVFNKDGTLRKDMGLVGVKEVTTAFAEHLVDVMCSSGENLNEYTFHRMGSGSTAETDTETALVTSECTCLSGAGTHGATSNIYQCVCTLTATTTFGCREHALFDTVTSGHMLDRSLVTNIALETDDEVEWTYALTVNAGG